VNEHEEKVRRLIALALNAGATDGESRNAAIQALRLIEKHGLIGNGANPQAPSGRDDTAYNHIVIANLQQRIRDLESMVRGARMNDSLLMARINSLNEALRIAHNEIDGLKREVMEERRKKQDADDRARRFRDHRFPTTVTEPVRASTNGADKPRRKIIRSQYSGTCNRCKEPFEVGDRIAWRKGAGALHLICYERELQEPA
jgi:RNA polymerase-binding transcription factor DksA